MPSFFRFPIACLAPKLLLLALFLSLCPASSPASEAGKEFNDADRALNLAYKALLTKIDNPEERSLFIHAQAAWIKLRDDNVAFFALRYPESKGGLFFKIHLTQERTQFLKALRAASPEDDAEGSGPSGYGQ